MRSGAAGCRPCLNWLWDLTGLQSRPCSFGDSMPWAPASPRTSRRQLSWLPVWREGRRLLTEEWPLPAAVAQLSQVHSFFGVCPLQVLDRKRV